MSINEGTENATATDRDETINHISSILSLLAEEFMDQTVTDLYEDAMSNVLEMHSAGRLDEDVADESEFIEAIKPALTLITKSYEKVEGGLGNE
jgi:hypothetical protein